MLIISLKSNPDVWIALRLSGLDINPLLLPIFKNLSFRWLRISSAVKVLKKSGYSGDRLGLLNDMKN